jgi:hypothetical protein
MEIFQLYEDLPWIFRYRKWKYFNFRGIYLGFVDTGNGNIYIWGYLPLVP